MVSKLKKNDVAKYVLLVSTSFRADEIASHLEDAQTVFENNEQKVITGTLNNEKVSVASTGIGCPATAILMEELIKCKANTFIRLGSGYRVCEKSLDDEILGCINIAAVRDENTTVEYLPIEFPALASRELVEVLVDAANKLNYNFIEGINQSVDSHSNEYDVNTLTYNQETLDHLEELRRSNVMSSDMASAIVFVVAQVRACKAASITSYKDMNKTIKVALEALKTLISQDKKENK